MKIPNNKTKLSVCIISKNEEKMLTECLESVTRIADEIIVVDTGSTDRTIEIAEKFGCRIYKEEWNNDFAYARNSAIAKARYPFILSIDADERLANPEKLKQILEENNGNIGGWLIKIISDINRANGGTDTHRSFQVRLFRNHLHFRFKGIIHEQIADSILKSGFRIEKTNLKIKHIGYSYSQEQMEQKQIRNLELLNLALTQKPDDSYVLFQRAKTFLVLNKLDEAEKDIIQALRYSNNDFTLKSQILNYGAMIAFRKRNFTSALQMVNETLLIFPSHPFAHFIKAEILMQTGNFSEAIKSYRRIRNSENNNDLLIEISGTYQFPDSQLAYKIGKCLFKLNKIAEAEKEFRKGLSFNPREIACILGLANIEFIRNNYNAAKMLLIQALSIEPENSEIKKHLQQTEKAIADKSKKVNKERPLISLAMIVKNEEKYLYDCLKSTVAVVDEIIIVDTGSTDKTKDIARSFNAKIFNFKWNDDFSSARNEALKHCSGEWILYLDADERLEKKTSKYIRTLVQNAGDNTGGFVCTIESEHVTTDGSTEMHRGAYPRIFRNYGYPRISFCGRVHEQISPSIIALGKSIKTSDIIITHLGYNQNSEMMKSKIQRNYSLLMKLVKEEPENAYAWYQLGQTLSHLSLKDEAEGVIRFAIESGKLSDSVYSSAASALAQFEGNRGNFKNALHWAEKSLEKAPNQVYAAYLKACSLLYLKRNAEAVAVFQKLLSRINAEKIVPQSGFDIDISKDEILKKLKEVRKYLNYPFTAE